MTAGPDRDDVPGKAFPASWPLPLPGRLPEWLPWGLEHRPVLLAATLCWVLVAVVVRLTGTGVTTALLVGWNVAAAVHVTCSILLMRAATPDSARDRARTLEDGRVGVLGATLAAVAVSVLALGADLAKRGGGLDAAALAFATLGCSWCFMQVLFAHQYLHEHWRDPDHPGFDVPGDPPDAWDFLYLSATLGATYQVSDIVPLRRRVRRLALIQAMAGWLFTVVVVAAAVNLSSSLLQ